MKRLVAIVALAMTGVTGWSFEAADVGLSPQATGLENAVALQKALDRGGKVTVSTPGVYKIAKTVLIGDDTELVCGTGVVFEKTAEAGPFSHVILNKGALTKTWNKNIRINGFELRVNGVDVSEHKVFGLVGHLAFFYVKDLRIDRFRCRDLQRCQFAIQICTFEDIVVDDVIIHGLKDGVHLGRGRRFTIRNGVFTTGDDPIALNAHDYDISNPELGWIEDGVIENCHDLGDPSGRRIGFFCRILAGAWVDWFPGMSVQKSDTVVANGALYRVSAKPDGKTYVSKTMPTHASGRKEYDGITWVKVQDDVLYNCGVRNVVFRDIFLHVARTDAAFSVHFDADAWSRSYYPNAVAPVQSNISFENVQVLYPEATPFFKTVTPVDSLSLVNCKLGKANLLFASNSPVRDYGPTVLQLIGCRWSQEGDRTLVENTIPTKRVIVEKAGCFAIP